MNSKNEALTGVPLGDAKVGRVAPVADVIPVAGTGRAKPVLRTKKKPEPGSRKADPIDLDIKLAGEVQTLSIKPGDLLIVKLKADVPPSAAQQISNSVRDRFNKLIAELNVSARVQVFITQPSESVEFSIVRKEHQAVMDSMEQLEEEQAAAGSTVDVLTTGNDTGAV